MEVQSTVQFTRTKLIHVLEPLCTLSYWMGIFPDWCHRPPRSRCSRIFNGIGICLSVLVLAISATFQAAQLIVVLLNGSSSKSIIYLSVGFFPHLTSFIFSVYFLLRRKKMLNFFQLWDQLENHPLIQSHWTRNKKPVVIVRVTLVIMTAVNILMVVAIPLTSFVPTMLTHLNELGKTINYPVLSITESFAVVYLNTVLTVGSKIPTLVAYQTGFIVQALESATTRMFHDVDASWTLSKSGHSISDRIHELWSLYEQLRLRVNDANDLFGPLVVLVHGLLFISICLNVNNVLLTFRSVPVVELAGVVMFLLMFIFFLVSTIILTAEGERSSRQLASTTAVLISRNSSSLTESERHSASSYLINVQLNVLTARPCDLYDVNYSLLLQMFSVVVTYTIIIMQSA